MPTANRKSRKRLKPQYTRPDHLGPSVDMLTLQLLPKRLANWSLGEATLQEYCYLQLMQPSLIEDAGLKLYLRQVSDEELHMRKQEFVTLGAKQLLLNGKVLPIEATILKRISDEQDRRSRPLVQQSGLSNRAPRGFPPAS